MIAKLHEGHTFSGCNTTQADCESCRVLIVPLEKINESWTLRTICGFIDGFHWKMAR
jgi:hypothetical protein